jgi:hypothetical protein
MKKKFKSTEDIGLGILQGLEKMNDISESSEKNDIKQESNKTLIKSKSKRSFMLNDNQIKTLYKLKLEYIHQDLSEIVGLAIDEFYERYQKIIVGEAIGEYLKKHKNSKDFSNIDIQVLSNIIISILDRQTEKLDIQNLKDDDIKGLSDMVGEAINDLYNKYKK